MKITKILSAAAAAVVAVSAVAVSASADFRPVTGGWLVGAQYQVVSRGIIPVLIGRGFFYPNQIDHYGHNASTASCQL